MGYTALETAAENGREVCANVAGYLHLAGERYADLYEQAVTLKESYEALRKSIVAREDNLIKTNKE